MLEDAVATNLRMIHREHECSDCLSTKRIDKVGRSSTYRLWIGRRPDLLWRDRWSSIRMAVEPTTATGAAVGSTAFVEGWVCLRGHGQMQSQMVSMLWSLAGVRGCGERGLASIIRGDG